VSRLVVLLAMLALSGCTVTTGVGDWLGLSCPMVEQAQLDPEALAAPGSEPECFLAWPTRGSIALAAKGDSADSISCEEREEAAFSADEPLIVRPGQIAWVFGGRGERPKVSYVHPACPELDAWIDAGGTPGELVAEITQ
jgi:hypothetical protein